MLFQLVKGKKGPKMKVKDLRWPHSILASEVLLTDSGLRPLAQLSVVFFQDKPFFMGCFSYSKFHVFFDIVNSSFIDVRENLNFKIVRKYKSESFCEITLERCDLGGMQR